MAESVTGTVIKGAHDWEGLYIDGELEYENHSVDTHDIERAINDKPISLSDIENKTIKMKRLGINQLPDSLDKLESMDDFADTVEQNPDKWEDKLKDVFTDKDYIMTDEADTILNLPEGHGQTLIGLFSTPTFRATTTPMGDEPLLELDYDNSVSGAGPAAYKLCTEES